MKLKSLFLCCVLAVTGSVITALPQTAKKNKPPIRKPVDGVLSSAINKGIGQLSWESEGSDSPRVFFLTAENGDPIDRVKAWAKHLPGPYRPEGYDTVETETIDELLDDVLNPEPNKRGELDEDEARDAVQWAVLKDIVITKLKDVQAFWLGSEINYQIIVVCGLDEKGNLVGFWMRHWSS